MNRSPLRRSFAGVVAVALSAATLAACGTDASSPGSSSSGSGSGSGKTIVFDYPYTSLPIYSVILKSARKETAVRGYKLTTTEDDASLDKQVSNLTSLLNRGVDAITTFPIEPSALVSVQKAAQAKGRPWVVYGGSMQGQDANIDFSGYKSGLAIAQAYGAWVGETGSKGAVLVLGNSTIDIGRTRTQGMLDGLKKFAPGVKVIRQDALGTDEGLSVTKAKLAANPEITAALGVNDDTAVGAAKAFDEAGRKVADSFVGGDDGGPVVLKAIKRGTSVLKATVAIDPVRLGQAVIDVPADLIEGKKTTGFSVTPMVVTGKSTNLDDLIAAYN